MSLGNARSGIELVGRCFRPFRCGFLFGLSVVAAASRAKPSAANTKRNPQHLPNPSRNAPPTTDDQALVSWPCPPVQYSKQSTYFVLARFRYCFHKPSFLTLRLTLRSCVSFRNVGFSVLAPKSFVLSLPSFGSTGASAVRSCRGCIACKSFSRLTCLRGFQ